MTFYACVGRLATWGGGPPLLQLIVTIVFPATPAPHQHYAAGSDSVPALEALLKFGARLDAGAHSAVASTLDRDGLPQVLSGLSLAADLNGPTSAAGTPLHVAAGAGALATMRRLLEAGADYNQIDGSGQTPLGVAVRMGQWAAAELLLDSAPHDGGAAADAERERQEREGVSELANRPVVYGADASRHAGSNYASVSAGQRSQGSLAGSGRRSPTTGSMHASTQRGQVASSVRSPGQRNTGSVRGGGSTEGGSHSMHAWTGLNVPKSSAPRPRMVLDERDIHKGRSELMWVVLAGQDKLARRLVRLSSPPSCIF